LFITKKMIDIFLRIIKYLKIIIIFKYLIKMTDIELGIPAVPFEEEKSLLYRLICIFNPNNITNKELFGSDESKGPIITCLAKSSVILCRIIILGLFMSIFTLIGYTIYLSATGQKI